MSKDRLYGVGLFLVAFALRITAAFAFAGEPVWDGHYYDFGAHRIAGGFGYSDDRMVGDQAVWHPWCHYPVGYSAYLSIFYRVFGWAASHHLFDARASAAHYANAFVGALLPLFTFLLARKILSARRARVASAIVALHPGLVMYGALVMSEPLSSVLVLAAFWVSLVTSKQERFAARLGRFGWLAGPIAAALVLGVGVLVRPQALLCAPFLGLAATRPSSVVKRLGAGVIACAATLLPVLPWTARNCAVMDGCALVSTNAGWNLAIGALPRATGRFVTLHAEDGCRDVVGQVQQDRCWLAIGVAEIEKTPGRWLGLVPTKLAQTFDHESFVVGYLSESRPGLWPESRRAATRGFLTLMHRMLVVGAAFACVGFALPRRKTKGDEAGWRARTTQTALLGVVAILAYAATAHSPSTFWPVVLLGCVLPWVPFPGRPETRPGLLMLTGFIATTAIAHAVFFGEDRYHVVVIPAFAILAAAALRRPKLPSPGLPDTDP